MRSLLVSIFTALLLSVAYPLVAAQLIKTHVAPFAVSGSPDKEDLKNTLPGLLASRLGRELIQLVDNRKDAQVEVAGSYAQFGKRFSLDAIIRKTGSSDFVRVFEQGESVDDLLPAMGKLAGKIDKEIAGLRQPTETPPGSTGKTSATITLSEVPTTKAAAPPPAVARIIEKSDSDKAAVSSAFPLDGSYIGIAMGRRLKSGVRELFLASDRSLGVYHLDNGLQKIAEITIDQPARILAIDSADLDNDTVPEIYLTIMDRETLASQVYLPGEGGLTRIAAGLPYFFRAVEPDGGARLIFAQEMGSEGEFYGSVGELVRTGMKFTIQNRRKLPRSGNIYTFNHFRDRSGIGYYLVLNEDGYLVASSEDGTELWRSSDKFGGSESGFRREIMEQARSGDQFRWTFLEQRMVVTPKGELILPRNDGFLSIGSNRSFNKHTLFGLVWNGFVLVEKWHSKTTPTYLADFVFDSGTNELIKLEVVQKESLFSKGKSIISIGTVE